MTPDPTSTVHARQADTLDALVHRHAGQTAGHTEATLAANPGLAESGAILAEGTAVRIALGPRATRRLVNLWD